MQRHCYRKNTPHDHSNGYEFVLQPDEIIFFPDLIQGKKYVRELNLNAL